MLLDERVNLTLQPSACPWWAKSSIWRQWKIDSLHRPIRDLARVEKLWGIRIAVTMHLRREINSQDDALIGNRLPLSGSTTVTPCWLEHHSVYPGSRAYFNQFKVALMVVMIIQSLFPRLSVRWSLQLTWDNLMPPRVLNLWWPAYLRY